MKILYYVPNYVPFYNSGDSVMAHAIATYLHSQGHEVTVMLNKNIEPYEHEGIKVIPRMSSMFRNADAVFCQLDTTQETVKLSHGPIFWVMHNTFSYPTVQENKHVNVIYNSQAAVEMMGWENDYCVLPPPVDIDYFTPKNYPEGEEYIRNNGYITLVNANENKGGMILHEIAKRMPDRKFLVVLGAYGTQFISSDIKGRKINIDNEPVINGLGHLPNVTILPNSPHMLMHYNVTKILLMPSLYESWGRVATEAMCSGIPVIANPTFGLMENIGKGGIFVQRDNIDGWVEAIKKLDGKKEYEEASAYSKKRSRELHPKEKLEVLEAFVSKKVSEYRRKREYVQ